MALGEHEPTCDLVGKNGFFGGLGGRHLGCPLPTAFK
jgi:hypothetical protein